MPATPEFERKYGAAEAGTDNGNVGLNGGDPARLGEGRASVDFGSAPRAIWALPIGGPRPGGQWAAARALPSPGPVRLGRAAGYFASGSDSARRARPWASRSKASRDCIASPRWNAARAAVSRPAAR